jgi:hypothetical protein
MIDSEFRSKRTAPEARHPRSGTLAVASFIIHHLGWQGPNTFWGRLSEMMTIR